MSTETIRLIRDGDKRVRRWVKREIIYLSLHCHHQNDSSFKRGCIKMDSDESHFNVSLIVRDTPPQSQTSSCPPLFTMLGMEGLSCPRAWFGKDMHWGKW